MTAVKNLLADLIAAGFAQLRGEGVQREVGKGAPLLACCLINNEHCGDAPWHANRCRQVFPLVQ